MRALPFVIAASLCATGCEKAGPKSSGKLSDEEASLMARLPNKFGLAFGGNLPRLQKDLAKSPLLKFSRAMQPDDRTNVWQDCLGSKQFKSMVGVVDVRSGFEMRALMTGIDMDTLEACAKQSNLTYKIDSDRKFLTLEVDAGQRARMPYLVLDDGAIYSRFKLGVLAASPKFEEPSRASMEADIEAARADSATRNDKLIASMEKADRSKGVWFAGSAEGTLIGDQVHEMFGTLDLEDGLAIDATMELADGRVAGKVMDSIEQARDAGGLLGSEVKRVIEALEVKRDGDRIRFSLKVSNRQLEAVFDTLSPMMPKARQPAFQF